MGLLDKFLHPERGYEKAQKSLETYFPQALSFSIPYYNQGLSAYPALTSTLQSLLNPEQLYDRFSRGYQESDAAKQAEDMATQRGLNAASSMGLLGSTPALQAIQAGTSQIASQDKQRYLDDLMQKYFSGAQLAQGLYNTGAATSGNIMNAISGFGQNQANLAYGRETAPGSMFGNLLGAGTGLLGGVLGAYLGGPQGALAGSSIGSKFGNAFGNNSGGIWQTGGA